MLFDFKFDLNFLVLVLSLATVFLLFLSFFLYRKLRRVLLGKDGKTLEDSIVFAKKEIDELREFEKNSMSYYKDIEKRLRRSLQTAETLRFNPFKGTGDGGNQSFSTSFLNENGDGLLLSSLHSRDRISIFAKPVSKFKSKFETTEEESVVLEKSKNVLKNKSAEKVTEKNTEKITKEIPDETNQD